MSSTDDHERTEGHSPGAHGDALLDQRVLQRLKDLGGDDDPGLFLELIDIFLQDAPQRIDEIRRGLEQGDVKLLERAAHTLKSSSANIGALQFAALCKRIEEGVRQNQHSELAELYALSLAMWPHIEAALRAARS